MQFWLAKAVFAMAALMHAAALLAQDMSAVWRWSQRSAAACSRDGGGIRSTPVPVSLPVCGLARQAANAARK